ncbi:MAG: Chaperone protein DnaJ, partial [Cyanobacteriota bacterium erpe_2018_sw_21hr_WHONDRS-SW48-000092_B_bin.40]|nr:Chaperone protein DnaJ [Cyanobacteriota bacterium erpe_2018_sw_21hr_WHONDRS-SW48-000092_B_bin.40]
MIMNLPAAYQILDLPVGSSLEVVQVRYRQLVKKYHPDRFTNAQDKAAAEARLKQINQAKEVIQKHWFEAKVKASEPIPYGAKESAAPHQTKAQGQAKGQSQAKTAPQSPPPEAPAPAQPRLQVLWHEFCRQLFLELEALFKKFEKKVALDEALEQLDKPFKFTSETKLRRAWYAIAIIIIVDLLYTGYCENMERRKNNLSEPQARVETRLLRGLTPVAAVKAPDSSAQEQRKRFENAVYFKRLQLDATERAVRKDSELIDEIEIKLLAEDMANENRRSLEGLKVFREQDKQQKEIERAAILEDLHQLELSQIDTSGQE